MTQKEIMHILRVNTQRKKNNFRVKGKIFGTKGLKILLQFTRPELLKKRRLPIGQLAMETHLFDV